MFFVTHAWSHCFEFQCPLWHFVHRMSSKFAKEVNKWLNTVSDIGRGAWIKSAPASFPFDHILEISPFAVKSLWFLKVESQDVALQDVGKNTFPILVATLDNTIYPLELWFFSSISGANAYPIKLLPEFRKELSTECFHCTWHAIDFQLVLSSRTTLFVCVTILGQ